MRVVPYACACPRVVNATLRLPGCVQRSEVVAFEALGQEGDQSSAGGFACTWGHRFCSLSATITPIPVAPEVAAIFLTLIQQYESIVCDK
ncbi:hypothetical protein NDU88_003000 [Pleurodeles waltl]|uniref:Uncharacterized protein n=1 Tax=Pleurodeles waltl TaxID=8319 RepID=A0AAV7UAX2_PLEWA|nr:hypothetical protein NDU88_003000 [Pleurodeles waltl]